MKGNPKASGIKHGIITVHTYRRSCNQLSIGLALINRHGQIIIANPAFRRIFGKARESSLQNIPLFLEMLNLSPAGLSKLLSEPQLERNFRHAPCHNRKGERIYLSYRLRKLRKNQILCEVRDTTQERAETLLPKTDQRLITAGEHATRITHALKGSSIALTNTLDLLREKPDLFDKYLHNLNSIALRIEEVIQQVLQTASEIDLEYEEINILDLIREIENLPDIQAKLAKGRIDITISGPNIIIEAEREQLREALVYIIENAIDAILEKSEPFGKIKVEITEDSQEGPEMVKINIQDDGVGISPDKMNIIFSAFYTTKKGGSGIGLGIARKIVEDIHGGRIFIESQQGAGTSFILSLPVRSHKEIVLQRSSDIVSKIRAVRNKLLGLEGNYGELMDACIASTTLEHIRKSDEDELVAQIKGQIDRLEEHLKTGLPHISVNNFSRRTEVVLVCPKDSATRNYWENLILYELQKMGLADDVSVVGTRTVERARAVSRIFEVKKFRGNKLTDEEMTNLETALRKKFAPIPSFEEFDFQDHFLKSAFGLMQIHGHPGSAHSLIFNYSLAGPLRLVGYKNSFFPQDPFGIEEMVAQRLVLERPSPIEMFQYLIEQQEQTGSQILIINETIDPGTVEKYNIGLVLSRVLAAFRINSILGAVFQTPSQKGKIINLICCESDDTFPDPIQKKFLQANQAWLDDLQQLKTK